MSHIRISMSPKMTLVHKLGAGARMIASRLPICSHESIRSYATSQHAVVSQNLTVDTGVRGQADMESVKAECGVCGPGLQLARVIPQAALRQPEGAMIFKVDHPNRRPASRSGEVGPPPGYKYYVLAGVVSDGGIGYSVQCRLTTSGVGRVIGGSPRTDRFLRRFSPML